MPAVTIIPPAAVSVKSSTTLRNLSKYHLENVIFVINPLIREIHKLKEKINFKLYSLFSACQEVTCWSVWRLGQWDACYGGGGSLSGGHRWLDLYLIEWAIELGKGFFSHDGFTWRGKWGRLSRVVKFNQPWGMTDSTYANGGREVEV